MTFQKGENSAAVYQPIMEFLQLGKFPHFIAVMITLVGFFGSDFH